MSARWSVDLESAAAVVRTLGQVEVSLEDVVRDLRWRVAQLHTLFEGLSADAHLQRHAQWSAAYADMQAALAAMRSSLDSARTHYQVAVDDNVSMWESVR